MLLMMLVNPLMNLLLPLMSPLVMFGMLELLPTLGPQTPGLKMPLTLLLPMPLMPTVPDTAMLLPLGATVTPTTAGEKYKQSETTPKKFNSRLVFTNINHTTVQISFQDYYEL